MALKLYLVDILYRQLHMEVKVLCFIINLYFYTTFVDDFYAILFR